MKTVLFRQSDYQNNLNRINEAVEKLNLPFLEFNSMNLFKIKSADDLRGLVFGGEKFVKSRIADELPVQSFGIFKLKKQSAVDLLDLPSFEKLNSLVEDCAKVETSMALNYCLIKNDKVTIDQSKLEALRQAYSTSTKTAEEERLLNAYHALVEAANTYSKVCERVGLGSLYSETPLSSLLFVSNDGSVKQSETYLVETWARLQRD